MKRLNCTRGWLAVLSLLAMVAFGVLVIVIGASLNPTQIAILSSIVALIGGDVKAAFAYFFDGTPTKPDPSTPEPTK